MSFKLIGLVDGSDGQGEETVLGTFPTRELALYRAEDYKDSWVVLGTRVEEMPEPSADELQRALQTLSTVLEDRYLDALGDDHDRSSRLFAASVDMASIAGVLGFDASDPYNLKPSKQRLDTDL